MRSLIVLAAALLLSIPAYATDYNSNRHVKKGIPCAACHGANNEVAYPTIDQCKTCHNPEQTAQKTKKIKPQNPHVSPHYGNSLDCGLCHLQHSPTENYCDQCHTFGFKVP